MTAPPRPPRSPDPALIERLAGMGVTVGAGEGPSRGHPARPAFTGPPIEDLLPGRWVDNDEGRCYVSIVRRGTAQRHGSEVLGRALEASPEDLAKLARCPSLADIDMGRLAYLDTETTGLSSGTGTYAFLVGIGRFEGASFHVRQCFMGDPSQERAQLAEVSDWLSDCAGLVTFNGRSFDLPLLSVRYRLHEMPFPAATLRHLDLLPVARRLWRRRLPSCALTSLEDRILGVVRHNDVPGWLIPTRYFEYQRDGDGRPLVPVFEHNATDILSMVSLLVTSARVYREPRRALSHGADWLSLARAYIADRNHGAAVAACEAALELELDEGQEEEARAWLAWAARRTGDWDRALAAWRTMIAGRPRRAYPFEELAKYYEHRAPTRDPGRALELSERAHALVASGALRPRRGRKRALADLEHRIKRLKRKQATS